MNRIFAFVVVFACLCVGCGKATPTSDEAAGDGETAAGGDDAAIPGEPQQADGSPEASTPAADKTQDASAAAGDGADSAADDDGEAAGGQKVEAGSIRLTAPGSWVYKPTQSRFIAAEFQLPRAEGDERDGRLTISMAGGGVEANINRWRGQFGGKPDSDSEDEVQIGGVTVTVVDFAGTYNDAMGPFAPGEMRPNYRMIGAVIPVDGRLHFVKAYGPQKTMEKHAQAFREFLQTLEVVGP